MSSQNCLNKTEEMLQAGRIWAAQLKNLTNLVTEQDLTIKNLQEEKRILIWDNENKAKKIAELEKEKEDNVTPAITENIEEQLKSFSDMSNYMKEWAMKRKASEQLESEEIEDESGGASASSQNLRKSNSLYMFHFLRLIV